MPRENLLHIDVEELDDVSVIKLTGELIAESRLDLERILREWHDAGRLTAIAHCAGLNYLDSAGLSVLLGAMHRFRATGGDLLLAEMNPSLNAIFEVTSMEKFFKIFPTLEGAREHVRQVAAQRTPAPGGARASRGRVKA